MPLLQHCIELSRPVLGLIPLSVKTAIKKALRYNINTPDYWDKIWESEGQDTWRSFENKYAYICDHVGDTDTVVDIGCGVGVLLRKLRETKPGTKLTGADISAKAVDILKQQGIAGVVGGFPTLPLPADTYDTVIATEVLEHLNEPEEAVREVVRLCKPGGQAILTVPDDCLGPEVEVQHVQQFTRDTFTALLSPYFEHLDMISMPDFDHKFLIAVCKGPKNNH